MSDQLYTAPLPSLIHRIGREQTKALCTIACEHGCAINRVRRSRHWQVKGSYTNLQALRRSLQDQDSITHHFVISKLTVSLEKIEPPMTIEQQLALLLATNPNVTLNEMMEMTQCTVSQARLARFENDTL